MFLSLPDRCSSIERSKEGLLVLLVQRQELWVIDEEDLEVKKRVAIPLAETIVSAPNLSTAFVTVKGDVDKLIVVDLEKGKIVKNLTVLSMY